MNTSEQINEIAAALAKAQGEMKNAFLNKVNPHFKSKYADLAGIRDAVTPALSKHGIAVVQGTELHGTNLMVFTRLVHSSGQWFESHFPVSIDKPQAMGSGITYGRRYTLSAITSIAADEDDDANAASESKPAPAPKPQPKLSVHDDAPRNVPATAHLTGTPNAPGNPEAKQLFNQLTNEMSRATSLQALEDWLGMQETQINKLPSKWMSHFDDKYEECEAALSVKGVFPDAVVMPNEARQ